MKAFIDEKEQGLWEQLVTVERTTGDFRGLEIADQMYRLILKKHPNAGRTDHMSMWSALRRNWSRNMTGGHK